MLLTADAILSADDRATEDVPVPEWNGTVRVMALSGTDRDAYESAMVDARRNGNATVRLHNFRAKLVVKCLVDAEGKRLFEDKQVTALAEKSGAVLDRLFDVARRLSGMNEKAVEEAAGNSESGQSGNSISA